MRRKRILARVLKTRLGQETLAPNMRFRVRKWTIETPLWDARPALRIGVLSDLHWGYRPVNAGFFGNIKRRLAALSPDMVVFLGDLSEGRDIAAKQANGALGAAELKGISAPLGAYAVLGNHDWHDDPEAQARRIGPVRAVAHLEAAGFRLLQNAACRPGRDDIWLAGLDSQQAFKGGQGEPRRLGSHDMAAALAAAPGDDPVILLAHEPDIFPEITEPRVVLTLSGHMHGGQIRPFGRAFYAPSLHGTRFDYGHFHEDGRHLVVSGGLGCSTIPVRIGIVPEITLVEIRGI